MKDCKDCEYFDGYDYSDVTPTATIMAATIKRLSDSMERLLK